MTLPGKYYLPHLQTESGHRWNYTQSPQPCIYGLVKSQSNVKCIFSSQRKAKNLTEKILPPLPGNPQREPCSICSHVIGEQNARKIGNPAILPRWNESGRVINPPDKEEERGVLVTQGSKPGHPFSVDTQGRLQTGGHGSFATRDCPAATVQGVTGGGGGGGVRAGPFSPETGRQPASSQLPCPNTKMDFIGAARWA